MSYGNNISGPRGLLGKRRRRRKGQRRPFQLEMLEDRRLFASVGQDDEANGVLYGGKGTDIVIGGDMADILRGDAVRPTDVFEVAHFVGLRPRRACSVVR